MRWKQIEDEPKVFALIFETGDEIASVLQQFAKDQGLGVVASRPSELFLARSWVGSTGKRKSTIQPAFSTNKSNCFRSIGDTALKVAHLSRWQNLRRCGCLWRSAPPVKISGWSHSRHRY